MLWNKALEHNVAFKENPMPIASTMRTQISSPMIHLEPAEVLSVLRTAKAKGSREWAMILVAYKHGMRASEICNLRLDDIDLKNEIGRAHV